MYMKKWIPSALTLINLSCGFLAVILNHPYISAGLVLCGVFIDIFDGLAARILKSESHFGKELDSLADIVTFGVAPAFLFYHHILYSSYTSIAICTLVPVLSAVRLANFNIDPEQSISFKGLPTPANAIMLVSFPILQALEPEFWKSIPLSAKQYLWLIPVLSSYLMVSPFRMFSFKNFRSGLGKNVIPLVLIFFLVVVLIFFKWLALISIVPAYIFLSAIQNVINRK